MDKIITGSLITAASSIFTDMLGMPYKAGEITYNDTLNPGRDSIIILIGFTGGIHGNVIFSFPDNLACKFAGTMMMQEITEVDGMVRSAACELSNMLLGNAATELSKNGVTADITPPTVLTGKDLCFYADDSESAKIPLAFENGSTLTMTAVCKKSL